MGTITKEFEAKENAYKAGKIGLEVPKLSEWKDEDLDALGEWLARQLIQYGPSTSYRSAKGEVEKMDSSEGRYLCKNGVFSINPEWRPGDRTEAQAKAFEKKKDKAIAKFKKLRNRAPSEDELELLLMGL
jgi:hypothetical protein